MNNHVKKWTYFILLSLIWGSSYILIKKGLAGLTPLQLGSVRILLTTLILLGYGYSSLKTISRKHWKWIVLTGYFGTFFPAYLFAFSETVVSSSVASVLNGMTPLFTLLFGVFIFQIRFKKRQIVGILTGLMGTVILVFHEFALNEGSDQLYGFLVIVAAVCYAVNVNLVKYKLQGVSPLAITTGNFVAILPPALGVLFFSDFPYQNVLDEKIIIALGYIFILSLFGTAMAKVLFNKLVTMASTVFSTSITYLLPIVAIGWGVLDGEQFTLNQWVACAFILLGVYLTAARKPNTTEISQKR